MASLRCHVCLRQIWLGILNNYPKAYIFLCREAAVASKFVKLWGKKHPIPHESSELRKCTYIVGCIVRVREGQAQQLHSSGQWISTRGVTEP